MYQSPETKQTRKADPMKALARRNAAVRGRLAREYKSMYGRQFNCR
jgi:hypothetical protein